METILLNSYTLMPPFSIHTTIHTMWTMPGMLAHGWEEAKSLLVSSWFFGQKKHPKKTHHRLCNGKPTALQWKADGISMERRRPCNGKPTAWWRNVEPPSFSPYRPPPPLYIIWPQATRQRIATSKKRHKQQSRLTLLIISHLATFKRPNGKIFSKKLHKSFGSTTKSRTFAPAKQKRGHLVLNMFS